MGGCGPAFLTAFRVEVVVMPHPVEGQELGVVIDSLLCARVGWVESSCCGGSGFSHLVEGRGYSWSPVVARGCGD